MSNLAGAFIFPHPPIMIEKVGGNESAKVKKTIDAANEAALRISDIKPDTIIIITPHGSLFRDAMSFLYDEKLKGNLKKFGAPDIEYSFDNDIELTDKIIDIADKKGLFCVPITEHVKKTYKINGGLDHGALVPLHFIYNKYKDFKLVHITYSMLSVEDHYKLGIAIKEAAQQINRRILVIASSDLSHRVTKDAHAGFNERGKVFDELYVDLIKNGEAGKFMLLPDDLLEAAGECGFRSTLVLLGCLDKFDIKGEIFSYEAPFGVGYCIAQIHFAESAEARSSVDYYIEQKKLMLEKRKSAESSYVKLARETLETYVKSGLKIDIPMGIPDEMLRNRAGVFVSIKKNGRLRGCIGTISAVRKNIAEEIIENSISAGTRDPRFDPIKQNELEELVYSVDVLGAAENINSKDELDVKRYGVIVNNGVRSGLLLPNLESVDTVEEQIKIACSKARISESEPYTMKRFEVVRYY